MPAPGVKDRSLRACVREEEEEEEEAIFSASSEERERPF